MGFPGYHIAQANIARALAPLDDPAMRGFVEQLDHINAVADAAPGFVWRLQTDEGDATGVRVFSDPLVIVNMSVWETIGDLYRYVYQSDHLGPLKERRAWFDRMDRPHSVLWWLPAGTLPDLAELERRLGLIQERGPGPDAFTFTTPFDPAGRPMTPPPAVQRTRSAR